jgi:hypothetical protein
VEHLLTMLDYVPTKEDVAFAEEHGATHLVLTLLRRCAETNTK